MKIKVVTFTELDMSNFDFINYQENDKIKVPKTIKKSMKNKKKEFPIGTNIVVCINNKYIILGIELFNYWIFRKFIKK